jgi:repressor of nif and glnA expression
MFGEEGDAREGRAQSHSVRAAILALLATDGCKMTAPQIRVELPGDPTLRSVHYHLRILGARGLVVEDGGFYELA